MRSRPSRAALVATLLLAGCASFELRPLPMDHPANPDAVVASAPARSETLAYGPADIPSLPPVRPRPSSRRAAHGWRKGVRRRPWSAKGKWSPPYRMPVRSCWNTPRSRASWRRDHRVSDRSALAARGVEAGRQHPVHHRRPPQGDHRHRESQVGTNDIPERWVGAGRTLGLSGCASVNPRAGFPEVGRAVEERATMTLQWNRGTELDQEAAEQLRTLLERRLTADDAVQIALLNNRDFKPSIPSLASARPIWCRRACSRIRSSTRRCSFRCRACARIFSSAWWWAFWMPSTCRSARGSPPPRSRSGLRVTGTVLEFAARVRTAFYVHQANEQLLELRQMIVQSLQRLVRREPPAA